MRLTWTAYLCATALATPVFAGTKPLYQPAPAWVSPAPAIDPAKTGAGPLLIFDQQQRLLDGLVTDYVDTATRIATEQQLTQAGTIALQWQPDDGDLIVHRIAILRAGQTVDLLAVPEPLSVLRRELGLESLQLDGILTATMSVPGLQVGDVLRVSYSITRRDPALKGKMQSFAVLVPDSTQVDFARARILWPARDAVRWKALAPTGEVKLTAAGDMRELTVPLPLPRAPELPADAPQRFHPQPVLEVSTFRDWPDVSRTMAPLFQPGTPAAGTPLAAEIARLKALSADPRTRAALALQSVQGNVRYLFNGLDHGAYTPQPAEKTWALRYGDCKAKTMLLLTLLKGLNVPAEPVLANIGGGDLVVKRLPTAGAFNHILVMANIDGQTYWLDGTGAGTRAADLGNTPNLRNVLPLRLAGAPLTLLVTHANARPDLRLAVDSDQSAGVGMIQPVSIAVTFSGGAAEQLKTVNAQLVGEKRKAFIDGTAGHFGGAGILVASRDIRFDDASGTATISVRGLSTNGWKREDQRYETSLDAVVGKLKLNGDRGRPEWRAIPVATGGVESVELHVHTLLPGGGTGFTLEGDQALPPSLAGAQLHRTVTRDGAALTVDDRLERTGAEIAPADIAAEKAKLALAEARRLKLVAPRDYPPHWRVARDATRAGKLKPVETLFTQALANATEKAPIYLSRAAFRVSVFDRRGALTDMDQAIAMRSTEGALLERSLLHFQLHEDAASLADAKAAYALDPGSTVALNAYAETLARSGQLAQGTALLDTAIEAGGEHKADLLTAKASLLQTEHKADAALEAVNAAIALKPGSAELLNARCWIKGTLGVQLDTALKDCTKAIEQGVEAAALDSRAMVYFKLGRMDDAMTDITAALDLRPDQAGSLYLRGAIERKQGARAKADDDLAGAALEQPRIEEEYARWGVTPA